MDSPRFSHPADSAAEYASLGPAFVSNCPACGKELNLNELACSSCHALVHTAELNSLSGDAQRLEKAGDVATAAEHWRRALTLLPPDAKQATWVREQLRALDARFPVADSQKTSKNDWARKCGPLGPILILLAKGKGLLAAIFKLKFLLSLFSFVAIYWALWGWRFGIGFAAAILIHEMGHYVDIRRRGLPAEMPVFLPGLGAYVRWQALGVTQRVRSEISLTGPLAGMFAAAACMLAYRVTGSQIWAALGRTGAVLNVLNLIPIWVLDGGSAITALARTERLTLLATCLVLWAYTGEAIFFLVAAGVVWRLFTKDLPGTPNWEVLTYYATVLGALGLLLKVLPAASR